MSSLPPRFAPIILAFSVLFRQHRRGGSTWRHAQLLLIGAILAPGVRTVTRVLRIMGHRRDRYFVVKKASGDHGWMSSQGAATSIWYSSASVRFARGQQGGAGGDCGAAVRGCNTRCCGRDRAVYGRERGRSRMRRTSS